MSRVFFNKHGDRVVWGQTFLGVYHATANKMHALCRPSIQLGPVVAKAGTDPSNHYMTCKTCSDIVRCRRKRAGESVEAWENRGKTTSFLH